MTTPQPRPLRILLQSITETALPESLAADPNNPALVTGVTSDSRKVQPGVVFVALCGSHTDGHQYLTQAKEAGAAALVIDSERASRVTVPDGLPVVRVPNTYKALAELSAALYDYPGKTLKLVGITGTNGKTTVTHLLEKMLRNWEKSVGLIGTLGKRSAGAQAYDDKTTGGHTTPMATELQEILSDMLSEKTEYVVMEVSSHSLDQYRVHGCAFEVAVLTNVTQDHLDYHKTMAHYWQSKAMLFKSLQPGKSAVINLDSDYADEFIKTCPQGVNVLTYSLENTRASVHAENLSYSITGASFTVVTPQGRTPVKLKIAGQFSVYNALAALTAGLALGIPLQTCVASMSQIEGVRGRFEVVTEEPYVIVDYAHTPDGLKNILNAARVVTPDGGRLICVFGCGGDRDATKRPKMGHIVEDLADVLVITSDNPRTEDPQQIITDIISGIRRFESSRMLVNADRRQAIHQAIDLAKPSDLIVIAGKGHETYQILKDRTIHFDDREEVQAYVQKTPVTPN